MKISNLYKLLMPVICCVSITNLNAQFDFVFTNPTLISGTDRMANAVYRFPAVAAGTDALVTIQSFGNGASLDSLDRVMVGYNAGFQPMLRIPSKRNGYVQFRIDFVITGTSTLRTQTGVHLTPLDVDGFISGTDSSFEYHSINLGGGYANYDMMANQLILSQSGTTFTGRNIRAIDFSGIDTGLSARPVMFTASHYFLSSLTIRMGCINNSTSTTSRNLSVVFKDFLYSGVGVLSQSSFKFIKSELRNNQPVIQWEILKSNSSDKIFLEKSVAQQAFTTVAEIKISSNNKYQYIDQISSGICYYRVKLVKSNGSEEYSQIVKVVISEKPFKFRLFPTSVSTQIILQMNSSLSGEQSLFIYNTQGLLLRQKQIFCKRGMSEVMLTDIATLKRGWYFLSINGSAQTFFKQ